MRVAAAVALLLCGLMVAQDAALLGGEAARSTRETGPLLSALRRRAAADLLEELSPCLSRRENEDFRCDARRSDLNVNPSRGDLNVNPSRGDLNVNPSRGDFNLNPSRGDFNLNPFGLRFGKRLALRRALHRNSPLVLFSRELKVPT